MRLYEKIICEILRYLPDGRQVRVLFLKFYSPKSGAALAFFVFPKYV
jgi:hypothetical protein